jgi:hypothetical protein
MAGRVVLQQSIDSRSGLVAASRTRWIQWLVSDTTEAHCLEARSRFLIVATLLSWMWSSRRFLPSMSWTLAITRGSHVACVTRAGEITFGPDIHRARASLIPEGGVNLRKLTNVLACSFLDQIASITDRFKTVLLLVVLFPMAPDLKALVRRRTPQSL